MSTNGNHTLFETTDQAVEVATIPASIPCPECGGHAAYTYDAHRAYICSKCHRAEAVELVAANVVSVQWFAVNGSTAPFVAEVHVRLAERINGNGYIPTNAGFDQEYDDWLDWIATREDAIGALRR